MFTSCEETINWIHSLLPHGVKPGTRRVELMLEYLGHPERRLRTIHVGGTNGKGSTVSFIRHMLQEGGYDVGTFTSPYLIQFNERVSVNGSPISDEDLADAANRMKPAFDKVANSEFGSPTEFETITVLAMVYFAEMAYPDFVLFEVGLGGRLDSTNVISPLVSVITNVGYDHMEILGHTIEEIASEKAGIIKAGVPLVTAIDKPEALGIVRAACRQKKSKIYELGNQYSFELKGTERGGETFSYRSMFMKRDNLFIQMKGDHQVKNAATALMAIDYMKQYYSLVLDEDKIREGLLKTSWPGRFEQVHENPTVILDGAHNPEGVESLKETIVRHFPQTDIKLIFAGLKNKNVELMLQSLREITDHITLTSFSFQKAAEAKKLAERAGFSMETVEENWKKAVENEMNKSGKNDVIIVTGSLYFISEVRRHLIDY